MFPRSRVGRRVAADPPGTQIVAPDLPPVCPICGSQENPSLQ